MSLITEAWLRRPTLPLLLPNPSRPTPLPELDSVGNPLLSSVNAFRSLESQTLDKIGRTADTLVVYCSRVPVVLAELGDDSGLVELEDDSMRAGLHEESFALTIWAIRSIS